MPTTSIARTQYKLEFHNVHPGQNFVPIDRKQLKLNFNPIGIGLSYKLDVETAEYQILMFTTPDAVNEVNRRITIVEASYTILTSRTNPAEAQPFTDLRSNRTTGIPAVIV